MKVLKFVKPKWPQLSIVFVVFMGFTQAVFSQSIITGNVSDDNGEPLPGASIIVKGSTVGSQTDFDGNYSIQTKSASDQLVFSYIGFVSTIITVDGKTKINVKLKGDSESLDEVVVVGYGSQKKSLLTGAVSSVSTEELTKSSVATLDNALQGKVSGVHVSTNSATPGGGVSVRIRGAGGINNSEPLYVVDGVPLAAQANENSSPLSFINPQDIASISVLKDAASAAMYGARAANGVVLITTKRGKGQGKGRVTFSSSYGVQSVAKTNKMMDGSTYANFINQANINAGAAAPFANPDSFGAGTNWIDAITRTAPMSENNISFSGGDENGNFFLSLGHFSQDGIVKGSSFERISIRANADRQVNSKLKVGSSISLSKTKQNAFGNARGRNGNPIFEASMYYPTIPVYDTDGNYAPTPASLFYKPKTNPLFLVEEPATPPAVSSVIANVFAEIKLTDKLKFKTSASYTYGNTVNEDIGRIYDLGTAISTEQSLLKLQSTRSTFLIENTLNYQYSDEKNILDVIVGQSAEQFKSESLRASGTYVEEGHRTINEFASELVLSNIIQEYSMNSYFGRVNYAYKGKYLITGNVRYDGSSRFGSNNRWGIFPAVSGAWNISKEDFFPTDAVVNNLKLRTGWGQTGSNEIGNYSTTAGVSNVYGYGFGDNGTLSIGSAPSSVANPDLKWETVTQFSLGVDADLFDNKLNLVAEYYNKEHTDMLISVPQSAVTGLSSNVAQGVITQNIADLSNSGFEISANYNSKIGEVTYAVGANLTTINNNVSNVGPKGFLDAFSYNRRFLTRTQQGRELGEFYGWVADGLFQNQTEVDNGATQTTGTAPGDIRYKDINEDGVINDDDKTFIGSPIPDFVYGFNVNLEYKNFDLSVQGSGVSGNEILNITKASLIDNSTSENKLNYTPWSSTNTSSVYPRAFNADPNDNIRPSSYFVEDGSFLRIKLIQLGYNFQPKILEKLKLSSLRLYSNVQNPFIITDYSGVDPEVGNAGGSNLSAGIDSFVYPISRTVSFGINASF
jgi:TonB-linked SusC/RagA family outer membrane protein